MVGLLAIKPPSTKVRKVASPRSGVVSITAAASVRLVQEGSIPACQCSVHKVCNNSESQLGCLTSAAAGTVEAAEPACATEGFERWLRSPTQLP